MLRIMITIAKAIVTYRHFENHLAQQHQLKSDK